ncbi:MAG: hypothetical protein WCQ64_10670 [Acidobacteriota bacterium]
MTRNVARVSLALALILCAASAASAQTSWGIAVQPNGAIYFCDRGHTTVWRLAPDGQRTSVLDGVMCRAMVTGPDGTVYGEATPTDVTAVRGVGLWQIDQAGTRVWLMAPTRNPDPSLWLVHDRQGLQYVWTGLGAGSVRSEIVHRDPLGSTIVVTGAEWGQQDGVGRAARLGNVAGMAVAPDGSIVVADSGNVRRLSGLHVLRTEATGVVTDSHLGLINVPGLWGRELGVATDASGAAVVVDPEAGRIVRVERTGRVTPLWEPTGFAQRISGGRWGWRPNGVAMTGRAYYVLDEWMGPALIADLIGSPRVSLVDAEGHVTRIAAVADWTVRAATAALLIVALSTLWMRRGRRATPSALGQDS